MMEFHCLKKKGPWPSGTDSRISVTHACIIGFASGPNWLAKIVDSRLGNPKAVSG